MIPLHQALAQFFLDRKHRTRISEDEVMRELRDLYQKQQDQGIEPAISLSDRYGARIPEVVPILSHWYHIGALDMIRGRKIWFKVTSWGYIKEVVRAFEAER